MNTSNITPEAAYRAALVHFNSDPTVFGDNSYEYYDDGLLVIGQGQVIAAGDAKQLLLQFPDTPVTEYLDSLISPGFIDTHTNLPRIDVVASYSTELLEWLDKHTFPAEKLFSDATHARKEAELFLDSLISAGTTTAMVSTTVHKESTEEFFNVAAKQNLRMIAGKVLMDRNAPQDLLDTPETGYSDTCKLIEKWHGHKRLSYAITPRFAPSSSAEQLSTARNLLSEYKGVYLHTNLSENHNEVHWVKSLFPNASDYLDVYDKFNLLGRHSVFAHCIHLSDHEWVRLKESNSSIAHCPMSNAFLGSGVFNFTKAKKQDMHLGLGTDIGGGSSFSMFRVMDEFYKAARLRGSTITPLQMWYQATLGGAEALDLDENIGNFAVGKEADFTVLNLSATPLLARRLSLCKTPADKLFALAILGDERAVREVYINGKKYENFLPPLP